MKLGKALATGIAEEQPEGRGEGSDQRAGRDLEQLRADGTAEGVEVREAAVVEEVPVVR
ncbi:hypothetical protein ABTZ58_23295 [Streptomyces sp. NPDC094143]|uniref:hypothetical protein n=1 Tax=Streptomyces sp. NPDC094143 TaxID=3155310 RepID=UPI0033264940